MTPIIECLKSKTFLWTQAIECAFQKIKVCMSNVPVLKLPNFSKIFKVSCDASHVEIEGVLNQDGHSKAYFSEKLNEG